MRLAPFTIPHRHRTRPGVLPVPVRQRHLTLQRRRFQGLGITLGSARRLVRVVHEVMTLVTCAGTRAAGGWLRQAVCGR